MGLLAKRDQSLKNSKKFSVSSGYYCVEAMPQWNKKKS
jgi:hypothetical protein